MTQSREQSLIDIAFEAAIYGARYMADKSNEEIAAWLRDQLGQCGFGVVPMGSSHSVLVEPKAKIETTTLPRAYTLDEIDQMRIVTQHIEALLLLGRSLHEHQNIYAFAEDKLRTYMMAGVTLLELKEKLKETLLTWRTIYRPIP